MPSGTYKYYFIILTISKIYLNNCADLHFTNLQCNSYNDKYATFDSCRLRAIGRSLNEMTIRIRILQPPVDNVTLLMRFMKKTNGYTPYYANILVDACKFLANRRSPLIAFFYEFIRPYTNVNHTCPYLHDVSVEKLRINRSLLSIVPVPTGDYALYSTWMTNNISRLFIKFFFAFNENS